MLAGIGVTIAVAQLHIVLGGTPQSSVLANIGALPAQLADLHPAAVSRERADPRPSCSPGPGCPAASAGRCARSRPRSSPSPGATAAAALAGLSLPRVDLPSWRSHALAGAARGAGARHRRRRPDHHPGVQRASRCSAPSPWTSWSPPGRTGRRRALRPRPRAARPGRGQRRLRRPRRPARRRRRRPQHGQRAGRRRQPELHDAARRLGSGGRAAPGPAPGADPPRLARRPGDGRRASRWSPCTTSARSPGTARCWSTPSPPSASSSSASWRASRSASPWPSASPCTASPARASPTTERDGVHHVHVRGQLTFLAVPRLSRALHQVPQGAAAVVELDGSFMDHAAYESLQDWQHAHLAHGGSVEITGRVPAAVSPNPPARLARAGTAAAGPGHRGATTSATARPPQPAPSAADRRSDRRPRRRRSRPGSQLAAGISAFQRNTAPLVAVSWPGWRARDSSPRSCS